MIKLAIAGCQGRMGRTLIEACSKDKDVLLVGGTARTPTQTASFPVVDHISKLPQDFDVFIDFTHTALLEAHLAHCVSHHLKMIIGTTGLSEADFDQLKAASRTIPIVYAPNMSVGMNLAMALIQQAAQIMQGADIDILDRHHRDKRDAPSGTALKIGEIISATQGARLSDVAVYDKNGQRKPGTIGFSSVRAGKTVGVHTVLFTNDAECLEITHHATDRAQFAEGAIRAAKWLVHQEKGLYDMQDVLAVGQRHRL